MVLKTRYCVLFCLAVAAVWATPSQKQGCRRPLSNLRFTKRNDNVIDLSYVLDDRAAYWPTNPSGFRLIQFFKGFVTSPIRFFYEMNSFSTPEHAGTHMDAPSHFAQGKHGVDEVSLDNMIGRGVLVDLVKNGERFGADSLVTIDHIIEWERKNNGRIRSESIVLIRTGYGDVYYDRTAYYGTNLTGVESVPEIHFPGLSSDLAKWLITNRCISAIGLDTPSTDFGQSNDFRTHRVLAENNIPSFENVANLRQLSEKLTSGFSIIALPTNIKGGSGAPTRIIAILD